MTPIIGQNLRIFHHRVNRRFARMQQQRDRAGKLDYPPSNEEMEASGLEEVDTYVLLLKKDISQCIATRPILELCMEA